MATFTHLVSSSRWRCATAPRPGSPPQRSSHLLRHSAPASNKPHPAEKSTPVWLAIWRTWAGFANSQMRRAAFRCTYSYICVPIPVTAVLSRCSDIANLSAHLHRLPTPPPYLRQMRLSPSRGRRYPISDKAAAWPGHRGLVLYMAATWPGMEFEQITEHGCES